MSRSSPERDSYWDRARDRDRARSFDRDRDRDRARDKDKDYRAPARGGPTYPRQTWKERQRRDSRSPPAGRSPGAGAVAGYHDDRHLEPGQIGASPVRRRTWSRGDSLERDVKSRGLEGEDVVLAIDTFTRAMHDSLLSTSAHSLATQHLSRLSSFQNHSSSQAVDSAHARVQEAEQNLKQRLSELHRGFVELMKRTLPRINDMENVAGESRDMDDLKDRILSLERREVPNSRKPGRKGKERDPDGYEDMESDEPEETKAHAEGDEPLAEKRSKARALLTDILERLVRVEGLDQDLREQVDTIENLVNTVQSESLASFRNGGHRHFTWAELERRRDPTGALRGAAEQPQPGPEIPGIKLRPDPSGGQGAGGANGEVAAVESVPMPAPELGGGGVATESHTKEVADLRQQVENLTKEIAALKEREADTAQKNLTGLEPFVQDFIKREIHSAAKKMKSRGTTEPGASAGAGAGPGQGSASSNWGSETPTVKPVTLPANWLTLALASSSAPAPGPAVNASGMKSPNPPTPALTLEQLDDINRFYASIPAHLGREKQWLIYQTFLRSTFPNHTAAQLVPAIASAIGVSNQNQNPPLAAQPPSLAARMGNNNTANANMIANTNVNFNNSNNNNDNNDNIPNLAIPVPSSHASSILVQNNMPNDIQGTIPPRSVSVPGANPLHPLFGVGANDISPPNQPQRAATLSPRVHLGTHTLTGPMVQEPPAPGGFPQGGVADSWRPALASRMSGSDSAQAQAQMDQYTQHQQLLQLQQQQHQIYGYTQPGPAQGEGNLGIDNFGGSAWQS